MAESRELSRPVDRAIWFIESHLDTEIALTDVARVAGVSRFHLTRAFGSATGMPIMRYVRARRLAKASEVLIAGEADILGLALSLGYGSHEAFSRAFRSHFGVTPSQAREMGGVPTSKIQEALQMNPTPSSQHRFSPPPQPRIVELGPLRIAGLKRSYGSEGGAGIPTQWQEFVPHIGSIPGQIGDETYGVCITDVEVGIDYVSGVRVEDSAELLDGMESVFVPQATYAVFDHAHHVSAIPSTWAWIWGEWLADEPYEPLPGPSVEFYPVSFDGLTGEGGLEIWVPVSERSATDSENADSRDASA